MPEDIKTCCTCRVDKPLGGYHRSTRSRDGRQARCKECCARQRAPYAAEYAAAWASRNPERLREHRRKAKLKAKYGITPDDFDHLFDAQSGACAICGVIGEPLCVDHSHITGAIRGLLCFPCNIAIGHMRDNPARLRSAADYLSK